MGLVDGAGDVLLRDGLDGVIDNHLEHLGRGGGAEKYEHSQTNNHTKKGDPKDHGIFPERRNRPPGECGGLLSMLLCSFCARHETRRLYILLHMMTRLC